MPFCKTCHGHYFFNNHVCPPTWQCWSEDEDPETLEITENLVYAYDSEAAAEAYASQYDNSYGEGPSNQTIFVRKLSSDEIEKFTMSFEYSVTYSAHKAKS